MTGDINHNKDDRDKYQEPLGVRRCGISMSDTTLAYRESRRREADVLGLVYKYAQAAVFTIQTNSISEHLI